MNADHEHLAGTGRRDGFWKALNEQVHKNEEATEALRRADQKYRSILNTRSRAFFKPRPTGTTSAPNPALARMYGYESPAELIAAFTDIGHQLYIRPNRRAEFIGLMREHGRVMEFESQIYRRDGSIISISENARGVHDEVSGELLYYEAWCRILGGANAGHPPPFHVRRGAGVVETLGFDEGHGPVLGIFEEAEYCTGATAAEDLVMLFADGLFEVEIANGEFYGQERLLAAVRDRMRLPAGELFGEVLAEVQERRVWREFEDDVCLVGMEVTRTGMVDASRRVA
jgi:PAS domain-containing protein